MKCWQLLASETIIFLTIFYNYKYPRKDVVNLWDLGPLGKKKKKGTSNMQEVQEAVFAFKSKVSRQALCFW